MIDDTLVNIRCIQIDRDGIFATKSVIVFPLIGNAAEPFSG